MASKSFSSILCVSLGMVITDEIHMRGQILRDVLGGSASFVALGQRLLAKDMSTVGCLVIIGDDFPMNIREEIESWGVTSVFRARAGKGSTRGVLKYEDDTFGQKNFTYVGEPLRAVPSDLEGTPLLHAQAFHFFGNPDEILVQVPELLKLRETHGIKNRPLIVWEPLPAACIMLNRLSFFEACRLVDIFSPNHLEAHGLFENQALTEYNASKIESLGQQFVDSSLNPGSGLTVIIRAGEHGAVIMGHTQRPVWFPPYYENHSQKVVDATGAGNTFLGGYIAGLQLTGDHLKAMCYGAVAASFALEQFGLPSIKLATVGVFCNDSSVADRLDEYKKRL